MRLPHNSVEVFPCGYNYFPATAHVIPPSGIGCCNWVETIFERAENASKDPYASVSSVGLQRKPRLVAWSVPYLTSAIHALMIVSTAACLQSVVF